MDPITLSETQAVEGSLPMYRDVVPLQPQRHARAAILRSPSYAFAAHAPTVPVTVDEFERAGLDYPILFFGPARRAVIITGLNPERNLFVAEGAYRDSAYLPAYLRRYPFVFARDADADRFVVCLDEGAEDLVDRDEDGALPLFQDGEPSEITREAISFCTEFEAAERRTERFVRLLDELELFEPRQVHANPRGPDGTPGEPVLLLEYVAVSRERLDALSDADFARLRASGALGPLYAHLLSAANWDVLAATSD